MLLLLAVQALQALQALGGPCDGLHAGDSCVAAGSLSSGVDTAGICAELSQLGREANPISMSGALVCLSCTSSSPATFSGILGHLGSGSIFALGAGCGFMASTLLCVLAWQVRRRFETPWASEKPLSSPVPRQAPGVGLTRPLASFQPPAREIREPGEPGEPREPQGPQGPRGPRQPPEPRPQAVRKTGHDGKARKPDRLRPEVHGRRAHPQGASPRFDVPQQVKPPAVSVSKWDALDTALGQLLADDLEDGTRRLRMEAAPPRLRPPQPAP